MQYGRNWKLESRRCLGKKKCLRYAHLERNSNCSHHSLKLDPILSITHETHLFTIYQKRWPLGLQGLEKGCSETGTFGKTGIYYNITKIDLFSKGLQQEYLACLYETSHFDRSPGCNIHILTRSFLFAPVYYSSIHHLFYTNAAIKPGINQNATPTLFLPGTKPPSICSTRQVSSDPIPLSPNVLTLVNSILFLFLSESIDRALIARSFLRHRPGLECAVHVVGMVDSSSSLSRVLTVLILMALIFGETLFKAMHW